ncbi:hypothetical protein [Marinobacterium stanieri]|uniref:hypothetical protein n=1 Tax=Marinobacterium stanieri TaxID=49186 RepID=UPI0002558C1C|nr:hypothetical protein [Marinobacterium stanieri]
MTVNSISFPHPVLGNGDDISDGSISPEISFQISDESIRVDVTSLQTGHPDFDRMIEAGEAVWHLRVQCPRTYMREDFFESGSNKTFHLEGVDFEGLVTIEVSLVTTTTLATYRPQGLHEDYGEEKFRLGRGEVVGIGPRYQFLIDKIYDPLKAPVSSIIRIEEGEDSEGPFTVALDTDLIMIHLSKSDYKEYAGITDRVPTVIHSALVLPVLADAIRQIEDYAESTLWAARLKYLLDIRDIDTEKPLQAAQEILFSPIARTFREVNMRLDKGDD